MCKMYRLLDLTVMIYCILVAGALSIQAAAPKNDPCLAKRKCSTTEEIVYAVDDHQCYLFRNDCIFTNDLCQRRENKEKELQVVSKDECQKKCSVFCTEEYFPLCAEYNNTLQTFFNECDFHRNNCRCDKSYMFVHYGACEEP